MYPRPQLIDIQRDDQGYFLYPDDWTDDLVQELASEDGVELNAEQQAIIHYVRAYYDQHDTVPEARKVLKFMKHEWGEAHATRKYLYSLFPYGYAQQACKYAGMRKPLKLMLDL